MQDFDFFEYTKSFENVGKCWKLNDFENIYGELIIVRGSHNDYLYGLFVDNFDNRIVACIAKELRSYCKHDWEKVLPYLYVSVLSSGLYLIYAKAQIPKVASRANNENSEKVTEISTLGKNSSFCVNDFLHFVLQDGLWGCVTNNQNLIPFKYDVLTYRNYGDGHCYISCGYNGIIIKHNGAFKKEYRYTGQYDLYDVSGEFLMGGFDDYLYDSLSDTYRFMFGKSWKIGKEFCHAKYHNSKWIVLNSEFCLPFNSNYLSNFKGRRFECSATKYNDFINGNLPNLPTEIFFESIKTINSTTLLCKQCSSRSLRNEVYALLNLEQHYLSNYYKYLIPINNEYYFSYDVGLGLLKDYKEYLPCKFTYITRPKNGWVFIARPYPYIPYNGFENKFYVLLWNVEVNPDFYIKYAAVVISCIDGINLHNLFKSNAFTLFQTGKDKYLLSSYSVLSEYVHWFDSSFQMSLNSPLSVSLIYSHCNWKSAEDISYLLEQNEKIITQDNYPEFFSLLESLDGNWDAYWNID